MSKRSKTNGDLATLATGCWFKFNVCRDVEHVVYSFLDARNWGSVFFVSKHAQTAIKTFLAVAKEATCDDWFKRKNRQCFMLVSRFCRSLRSLRVHFTDRSDTSIKWFIDVLNNNYSTLQSIDTGDWNLFFQEQVFPCICNCHELRKLDCKDKSTFAEDYVHLANYDRIASSILTKHFPKLTSLILPSKRTETSIPLLLQPFSLRILHLNIADELEIECLNMAHFRKLEELQLDIDLPNYTNAIQNLTFALNNTLPCLTKLEVSLPTIETCIGSCTWNMPKLKTLTILSSENFVHSLPRISAPQLSAFEIVHFRPHILEDAIAMAAQSPNLILLYLVPLFMHVIGHKIPDNGAKSLAEMFHGNQWPNLASFTLNNGAGHSLIDAALTKSFGRLQKLDYNVPQRSVPDVLRAHPHLTQLSVWRNCFSQTPLAPPQIPISTTRKLTSYLTDIRLPYTLDSQIQFPVLTTLHLECWWTEGRSIPVSLLMLCNQCPALQSLELNTVALVKIDPSKYDTFEGWPIQKLQLFNGNIADIKGFYLMTAKLSSLRKFSWSGLRDTTIEKKDFFSLLEQRPWPVLQSLSLPKEILFDDMEAFYQVMKALPVMTNLRCQTSLGNGYVRRKLREWCRENNHVKCNFLCR